MMRKIHGKKVGRRRIRRKRGETFLLLFCILLLGGCGRGQETAVMIGRSGQTAEPDGLESEQTAGWNGLESGQTAGLDELESGQTIEPDGPGSGAASEEAAGRAETFVYVYVCGAVNSPGVVPLEPGSRVEDALEAAGGFSETADRNYVNLAAWVADGEQLYFPTEEEALVPEMQGRIAGSGLVNINTADAALLCTLPGIGEARAEDIIAYRETNGGFQTEEDIMKVSGIKTAAYEKIRDKITVK